MAPAPELTSAVWSAVEKGDADALKALYEIHHSAMNNHDPYFFFNLACKNNLYECAMFFAENVDISDIKRRSLFQQCCQESGADIVALLVALGADPRIESDAGIYWSAQSGNIEVLKYLVEYSGLDRGVESITKLEKEALELAVRLSAESGHTEVVAYLDSVGIDLHHNREQALRNAARDGHVDTVKLITSRPEVDIDAVDGEPIRIACKNSHTAVVSHLVEAGAYIHVSDDAPIKLAAIVGDLEALDLLFKQAPDYFTNLFKTDEELLGIDMAQAYLAERLLNGDTKGNRKRRALKV